MERLDEELRLLDDELLKLTELDETELQLLLDELKDDELLLDDIELYSELLELDENSDELELELNDLELELIDDEL